MDDLEYFNVNEDGSQTKIDGFPRDSDKVYVIVDHKARFIFLWKGLQAHVRLKFIGSRAMGDTRKEIGFHYKIEVIDEDDESRTFKSAMGEEVEGGIKTGVVDDEPGSVPSYAEAAAAQGIDVSADEISSKTGGTTTVGGIKMGGAGVKPQRSIIAAMNDDGEIDTESLPKTVTKAVKGQLQKDDLEEAKALLSELGKPKGYEREMVVVGNKVYRSKGDTSLVFEDLDNPLDGLFMVESYTPRLVCENGRVIAIELLKRTSEDIDDEDLAMSQDLEDLTAMFQIELE